ncbi:MAG: N-acetylglucosamine kinase [Chitinophagaceae bacterium]|nr:N-acetylglucosamine kinase [Chitinophagaceae bacterium]HMN33692.1 N-acetylglucosamine kinase [Chitinophagaceae bacterium]
MNTKIQLIIESGSTKTDWCLIQNNKSKTYATQGINPLLQTDEQIKNILTNELKMNLAKLSLDEIHFYGAGVHNKQNKTRMNNILKSHFRVKKVETNSDMFASARATCFNEKGIVCILGTGSNSCYYNGKKIEYKTTSLGYLLGDEGSGNHIGKKVLQYYLNGIFDQDLKTHFEEKYEHQLEVIFENLYQKSFPNRYLASFAPFVFEHRGHYMIENIAEDCINDFFITHLLRYPSVQNRTIHFTGTVAFYLKDILQNLCNQYGFHCGQIIQKPIKKLIAFHQQ